MEVVALAHIGEQRAIPIQGGKDSLRRLKTGVLLTVTEQEEAALLDLTALREGVLVVLEPLVVQLEQVSLRVGHHGFDSVVRAVHNSHIGGHIEGVGVILIHTDGEVILSLCTLGQGQRHGLSILQQIEVNQIQITVPQCIPIGAAHIAGPVILELQAHGQHEGIGQEVGVVQRQIYTTLLVSQFILCRALRGVAAVCPHMDLKIGSADQLVAVQGLCGDLAGGILVGADGHIQQIQIGPVGIQAGQISPHELCTCGTGVAGHLQHPVCHHLGHLHDGVYTDALIGGVPPALVAGDDGAEGSHLVPVVAGQGAAGGAHRIGDVQQIIGAAELPGIKLDGRLIAGILQSGQGVVMGQVQRGGAELRRLTGQPKALRLTGIDHGLGGSVVVCLSRVHTSDVQGQLQGFGLFIIEGEILHIHLESLGDLHRLIIVADIGHGGDGQIGSPVIGIAQQAVGNIHILADVGLALHAVPEKQVGNAVGGFLQLQALRECLRQEIHSPDHRVLTVLRHGHLHGHVGIDFHGQGLAPVVHPKLDLFSLALLLGQPAPRSGSLRDLLPEGVHIRLLHPINIQGKQRPGRNLVGTAEGNVLQSGVSLPQGDARPCADQPKGLALVSGEIHGEVGHPFLGVAHHHGEPGIGGVGRNGGFLPVQRLIGPVVIEAGITGVIGDVHVLQCVFLAGHPWASVLIDAHDDTDAAVELHTRILKGLGCKEGGQGGTAVVLNTCAVQPAILHIGLMVGLAVQFAVIVPPAVKVSAFFSPVV